MKVILISSIVPGAGGGRLVLYHHFKDPGAIELLVVCDGPVPGFNHKVLKHRVSSRIFKRVAKTFFETLGVGLSGILPAMQTRPCGANLPGI